MTALERKQNPGNLAWIDLEMTGLHPDRDVIIQAALVVTDRDLGVLEEMSLAIWQPEAALSVMSPFVRDMHEKTGLLPRVRESRTDLGAAQDLLLERVAGWCPYPATLCGNSVWMDRLFLGRGMPALAGYFSHRLLDVSAVKVLAKHWYGEQAVYEKPKSGEHDAIVDIRHSIRELQHYRDTMLRPTRA